MDRGFRCENERRRQLVASSTIVVPGTGLQLNGIDFLNVIDREAQDPAERQRIIELHFLKSDGVAALGRENVRIVGGERITAIAVVAAAPLAGSDRALRLTVDQPGDFSTYRLRLVDAQGEGPPANFDPALGEIAFSFKIDCGAGFDCADDTACAPDAAPSPALDYLAKDYESFRRLMLDRMAATMPNWRERSPADLGVTLVELLADAADRLSYFQDAVATEAYLGTARRRRSVRRHARLTSFALHEGCNARAFVAIAVGQAIAASDLDGRKLPVLPRGTRLLGRTARAPTLPDAGEAVHEALHETGIAFETLEDIGDLRPARNRIAFHTWSDERCCLGRGATSAWLVGSRAALGLAKGDMLIFEEIARPNGEPEEPAEPTRRHVVRLAADPVETTDPLLAIAVVAIRWHDADALPFALALYPAPDGGLTAVARGNVVLADHGLGIGVALDPPAAPADRPWRPTIASDLPITHAVRFDPVRARDASAAAALTQDPADAVPALILSAANETWRAARDLLALDRFAPAFVLETEPGERPGLRFGDGSFGRRPAAGQAFTASMRTGNGPAGNVGAEAIGHVVLPEAALRAALSEGIASGRYRLVDPAITAAAIVAALRDEIERVRNPLPAVGGRDAMPVLQAKLDAPQAFRTQARTVTTADYVAMAERHPEVQRAVATRRWVGSWYVNYVTVDRRGGRPVDAEFEADLAGRLERTRLAGHDIEIEPPRFVPLDLALVVCVAPGHIARVVEAALRDRFSAGTARDRRPGFFHPDNLSFGRPIRLSPIVAAAMQVPGVLWVGMSLPAAGLAGHFRRLREPAVDYADQGEIPIDRLEVAVLDNDPNRPEQGRLQFLLEGGL